MSPRIRCREIRAADIEEIVNLLNSGFRRHSSNYWMRALKRLTERCTPPGFPKYGYLLERNGSPVGVILLIFSLIIVDEEPKIRCSVSSWYVEPAFRCYAAMLTSRALKCKQVTYFNITPDPHTLPILEAQGYRLYCDGRFLAAPALSQWSRGARVRMVAADVGAGEDLPSFEVELLLQHAEYGCISVTCNAANRRHPFVFLPRRKAGLVPFAYLAYCRDVEEFVRFAGPLGRFLGWHGFPLVVLDANGPVAGLIGWYSGSAPKYFKGPDRPRLGDIAYSERVMFGF